MSPYVQPYSSPPIRAPWAWPRPPALTRATSPPRGLARKNSEFGQGGGGAPNQHPIPFPIMDRGPAMAGSRIVPPPRWAETTLQTVGLSSSAVFSRFKKETGIQIASRLSAVEVLVQIEGQVANYLGGSYINGHLLVSHDPFKGKVGIPPHGD